MTPAADIYLDLDYDILVTFVAQSVHINAFPCFVSGRSMWPWVKMQK
jgi:hypothetical protein